LEYIGTVLLWSWLGDICPTDIRGRFIGNRERYMLIARIAGMLAAGGFAWIWNEISSSKTSWISYAIPASLAAALMLTAILPLIRMPDPARRPGRTSTSLAPMFAPLRDARLLWLLGFGAWFSLANGLTQSAQYLFPIVVFSLPLLVRNVYTSGMRLGQAALAPSIGAYADAFGNRRVLIVSQLIVAMGPLFFVLAARLPATDYEHAPLLSWMPLPWWILAGAWITWIAYVGLNVGLPNLMLKLAGGGDKASYVAWYFAVTGVVYGISTIAGGALYAWLEATKPTWTIMSHTIDHHDLLFTAGFVLRATAVVWLLPIADGQSDLRTR
jgi:MFS family permease